MESRSCSFDNSSQDALVPCSLFNFPRTERLPNSGSAIPCTPSKSWWQPSRVGLDRGRSPTRRRARPSLTPAHLETQRQTRSLCPRRRSFLSQIRWQCARFARREHHFHLHRRGLVSTASTVGQTPKARHCCGDGRVKPSRTQRVKARVYAQEQV